MFWPTTPSESFSHWKALAATVKALIVPRVLNDVPFSDQLSILIALSPSKYLKKKKKQKTTNLRTNKQEMQASTHHKLLP